MEQHEQTKNANSLPFHICFVDFLLAADTDEVIKINKNEAMKGADGKGKHRWEGVILDRQPTFTCFFNEIDKGLE